MLKGQIFKAIDKLNQTYNYMYCGVDETIIGCYNIRLYNMDTKTDTYVENEWFNQRKISMVA
jgi:gamma-glutamylcyclotransferase (GGCT)/AIG2-like uncharacterized protein YtfP